MKYKMLILVMLFLFCLKIAAVYAEISFSPIIDAGLGNDDNLNYTPEKATLPGMEKQKDSFYSIVPQLKLKSTIPNYDGIIGINYQYKYNKYIKKDNGNFQNNYLSMNYELNIKKINILNLQISYNNYRDSIKPEDYSTSIGFSPELKFIINKNQSLAIAYNNIATDYQNRFAKYDANFVPLGTEIQKDNKQSGSITWMNKFVFYNFTGSAAYIINSNNSNDNNFDYNDNGIYAGVYYNLSKEHLITIKQKYILRKYIQPQIISGVANRKDTQTASSIGYEYLVDDFVTMTANYSYNNNKSNDAMEKYSQNIIYAGIKINFRE